MKLLQHTYILLSMVTVMVIVPLAKISGTKGASTSVRLLEKTVVITDTSLKEASPAAYYSDSDNSWSFSGHVLEIKDVSIYGRPGSIARIQYVHRGNVREAWAALK